MRNRALTLALIFLGSPVGAQEYTGWQFSRGETGAQHELTYIPAGDHHPDVFMFCRPNEGFVFVRFNVERHSPTEVLRAGGTSVSVPASYDDDPHFDWDSATVALPSDHLLFRDFANGADLAVGGTTYVLGTPTGRRNAANFVRVCQLSPAG